MNTLIASGTGAAYLYSVAATVAPSFAPGAGGKSEVYYETAAVIITLILLGRFLEARARGKAADSIRKLIGLKPRVAMIRRGGKETEVPVDDVVVDDTVIIRPGERIPVDGIVLNGNGLVDEAMITGEPIPVQKSEGDTVVGGTINRAGAFDFAAVRVGENTTLYQIIRLVEQAQGKKAPVQRLADKVAGRFVPVVIVIAIITFIVWYLIGDADTGFTHALTNSVAVLIIACPCALGLATPTAILVGTGKAAEKGILFKGGDSLEIAHRVRTVVLDKTGTVTSGKPELTIIQSVGDVSEHEILRLAAAVEGKSEHPIGEAIVRYARSKGVEPGDADAFASITGQGVEGTVEGRRVVLGNTRYLQKRGELPPELFRLVENIASDGKSSVLVSVDNAVVGVLGFTDTLKPGAGQAIRELKQGGLNVVMLTGDSEAAAMATAREAGITDYRCCLLPQQKVEEIKQLQFAGHIVAMVGDGINDAPALVQADLGIALGTGTDVAIESAGVTLVREDLHGVAETLKISRLTMKVIRQNLFWAFAYNLLCIPIAAGVFYPVFGLLLDPMVASAAMALSSVSVVGNSLRLRKI
jgi:Cu+-exporting ATPase